MENNLENAKTYLLGRITTESDQEDVARVLFQYASLVRSDIVLPSEDEIRTYLHGLEITEQYPQHRGIAWLYAEIKRLNPSNSEG